MHFTLYTGKNYYSMKLKDPLKVGSQFMVLTTTTIEGAKPHLQPPPPQKQLLWSMGITFLLQSPLKQGELEKRDEH